jgi:superfamily II DNA or RNA helicase
MGSTGREDPQRQIELEKARLAELERESQRVARRISELEAQIRAAVPGQDDPSEMWDDDAPGSRTIPTTTAEKVALFRDLFRGRPDVHPQRWENQRKGTKGFSPACGSEWARGICEKPRVKCGQCTSQDFLPVTDGVLLDHLKGGRTIGVYPLLQDDTCWFLAMDLDGASWQDDVGAIRDTCRSLDMPASVERSRSGQGAHIWFFFEEAVQASMARRVGDYLIAQTMARRHELPIRSYDRLFPNQDTLPRGGFGNLIALPFQDGARQEGNSVFVDEHWQPYADQWAYLARVKRIPLCTLELLAERAAAEGRSVEMADIPQVPDVSKVGASPEHWSRLTDEMRASLPDTVRCVLEQRIFVEKAGLPPAMLNQIVRLAAFPNPEFYKKQGMRMSTALTPRVISCAEDLQEGIGLPRGCLEELKELLTTEGMGLKVEDKRSNGQKLEAQFEGNLTEEQESAFGELIVHDYGVLVAPPGTGKTVIGIRLIAERARNTLVLVHRTQLLDQWIAQLALFLDLDLEFIGQLGGGKNRLSGVLDVAMVQSVIRHKNRSEMLAQYGHILVDECHHVPAVSVERLLKEAKARYLTGLTATPRRRDGQDPILRYQLGSVRSEIDPKEQASSLSFRRRLVLRETTFRIHEPEGQPGIQGVYREMASDGDRNRLIVDDVIAALEERRSPLLLTERRDHLEFFVDQLRVATRNLIVLRGGMGKKQREAEMKKLEQIPDEEERLVVATGRYIGEGFDDARLDTLFLAMPISWRGTLVQYAGRLHRQHDGKTEVRIVDYVDREVPMLEKMTKRRMRGYRSLGYVVDDGSPDVPDLQREPEIVYDGDGNDAEGLN